MLMEHAGGNELYNIYSTNIEKYLPSKFDYTQVSGPTVNRPLFGSLIKQVGAIVDKLSNEELANFSWFQAVLYCLILVQHVQNEVAQ